MYETFWIEPTNVSNVFTAFFLSAYEVPLGSAHGQGLIGVVEG